MGPCRCRRRVWYGKWCRLLAYQEQLAPIVVGSVVSGPRTTKKPCIDKYSNCPDLARTACYQDHIANGCQKSCGLCQGMTPARSYTCYNKYSNCANLLNRL